MKRCELCGSIAWRGRTGVSMTDGSKSLKISINGKDYDSIKVCRKCVNTLLDMFLPNKEVKI